MFGYSNEYLVFLGARIVGVAIKPIILLLMLHLNQRELATHFALITSTVASTFILFNNQNFRALYQYFLPVERERGIGGKDIVTKYLAEILIHMIAFLPIVLTLVWFWVQDLYLLSLTIFVVVAERYFDDDQRILIYKREYLQWSLNFCFRIILPGGVLLTAVLLNSTQALLLYVLAVFGSLLVFLTAFRQKFSRVVWHLVKKLTKTNMSRASRCIVDYSKAYRSEYFGTQVWGFLAANLLLLDRFFVSRQYPDSLAEYVLIVNIASIIPLVHNLLFFTKIRPTLMDSRLSPVKIFLKIGNLGLPAAMAIAISLGLATMIMLDWLDTSLTLLAILTIIGIYLVDATNLVTAELAFWRAKRGALVGINVLSISITALLSISLPPNIVAIPLSLAIGLIIRNLLTIMLCQSNERFWRIDLLPTTKPSTKRE